MKRKNKNLKTSKNSEVLKKNLNELCINQRTNGSDLTASRL